MPSFRVERGIHPLPPTTRLRYRPSRTAARALQIICKRPGQSETPTIHVFHDAPGTPALTLTAANGMVYRTQSTDGVEGTIRAPAGDYRLEVACNDPGVLPNSGDALFFHANFLHRSDQNRSPNPRWGFICCYNTRHNDPYKESRHPGYSYMETWGDERVKLAGRKFVVQPVT